MTTSIADTPKETIQEWSAYMQDVFNRDYMSAAEVQERYGVSMSYQYQLFKSGRTAAISLSQRLFYARSFAEAWFADYVAKQQARIAEREAAKQEKARKAAARAKDKQSKAKARQRKASPDAWRYFTFNGQECAVPPEFSSRDQYYNRIKMDVMRAAEPYINVDQEKINQFMQWRDDMKIALGVD